MFDSTSRNGHILGFLILIGFHDDVKENVEKKKHTKSKEG